MNASQIRCQVFSLGRFERCFVLLGRVFAHLTGATARQKLAEFFAAQTVCAASRPLAIHRRLSAGNPWVSTDIPSTNL
jgi:hypothetical protein